MEVDLKWLQQLTGDNQAANLRFFVLKRDHDQSPLIERKDWEIYLQIVICYLLTFALLCLKKVDCSFWVKLDKPLEKDLLFQNYLFQ